MYEWLFRHNSIWHLIFLRFKQLSSFVEKTVKSAFIQITGAAAKPAVSLVADIQVMQGGSGVPSPTNERPIMRNTKLTIQRTGKNLLDPTVYVLGGTNQGRIVDTSGCRGMYMKVPASGKYTISRKIVEGNRFRIYASVNEPANNVSDLALSTNDTALSITVDFPSGYNYLFIYLANDGSNVTGTNVWVEQGDTATEYEPYGQTYTVAFPSGAGMVCGGVLNVTTGELTVTWKAINLGTLSWVSASPVFPSGYGCRAKVANRKFGPNTSGVVGYCDSYEFYGNATTSSLSANMKNLQFGYQVTNNYVWVRNDSCTSTSEMKTELSGVYLCYELETPATYTLTPTEVDLLAGENNIWSNANGEIELTYFGK